MQAAVSVLTLSSSIILIHAPRKSIRVARILQAGRLLLMVTFIIYACYPISAMTGQFGYRRILKWWDDIADILVRTGNKLSLAGIDCRVTTF
jgi:hypothetical protein